MVAENTDGSETTVWDVFQYAAQLLELLWAAIRDPVTCEDYKVWSKFCDSVERFDDVGVINFWTNMYVADLRDCKSIQSMSKPNNR